MSPHFLPCRSTRENNHNLLCTTQPGARKFWELIEQIETGFQFLQIKPNRKIHICLIARVETKFVDRLMADRILKLNNPSTAFTCKIYETAFKPAKEPLSPNIFA